MTKIPKIRKTKLAGTQIANRVARHQNDAHIRALRRKLSRNNLTPVYREVLEKDLEISTHKAKELIKQFKKLHGIKLPLREEIPLKKRNKLGFVIGLILIAVIILTIVSLVT